MADSPEIPNFETMIMATRTPYRLRDHKTVEAELEGQGYEKGVKYCDSPERFVESWRLRDITAYIERFKGDLSVYFDNPELDGVKLDQADIDFVGRFWELREPV
jgi:hypothetical protein